MDWLLDIGYWTLGMLGAAGQLTAMGLAYLMGRCYARQYPAISLLSAFEPDVREFLVLFAAGALIGGTMAAACWAGCTGVLCVELLLLPLGFPLAVALCYAAGLAVGKMSSAGRQGPTS